MTGPISKHFSWEEALYLPQWSRQADELDGLSDVIKANLVSLFNKLDIVRDYFQKPIIVHVTYRPLEYNKLIGGAPNSSHIQGLACDFHIDGLVCDDARQTILDNNKLEEWNMRMENRPESNWIHLGNDAIPGHNLFFLP